MNNNFFQILQIMQQQRNPQQAFMSMIQQSPQYQQQMKVAKNMMGDRTMEQTVKQLARQQGISEEQIMQAYNSLANKR
jgi:glycerol-3-phosphate O-acyltransferase